MTRILPFLIFLSPPAFACGVHDETGNDMFEMKLCAANKATCDPNNDPNGNCRDIPVFPLTEEDLQAQPPTPDEQWAAVTEWRRR